MALDLKYGRVTTEFGTIGEDEPVVVFRAQDRLLPEVLRHYWATAYGWKDVPEHHLELIQMVAEHIQEWQEANKELVRLPNSNAFVERVRDGQQPCPCGAPHDAHPTNPMPNSVLASFEATELLEAADEILKRANGEADDGGN